MEACRRRAGSRATPDDTGSRGEISARVLSIGSQFNIVIT